MKNRISHFCNALLLWMSFSATAHAETFVLAVPGPGTFSYLPVYLAKALAANQTGELDLRLRYFSAALWRCAT